MRKITFSSLVLPIGKKLRQARIFNGLSQENVAYAIKKSRPLIHHIESGKVSPTDDVLKSIRESLEIEHAPLLEHEIEIYKYRLLVWEDLLDSHRLTEAKIMQTELSHVIKLPYERDLILRYLMLETRLYFVERNFTAAEENLTDAEPLLADASDAALYAYECNMGSLYSYVKKDYKSAISHYLKAKELDAKQQDVRLLVTIGMCYSGLNKHHHAIRYYEQSRLIYNGDRTNPLGPQILYELAMSYSHVGSYQNAENLYDIALKHSYSIGDELLQLVILTGWGTIEAIRGNYSKAVEQFDKAWLLCYKNQLTINNQNLQLQLLSYPIVGKAYCMLKMGKRDICRTVIEQGRLIADENEPFTIMLNATSCLINLGDESNVDYLENTAIPYLISCGEVQIIFPLTLCRELEAYYKKKKAKTKAANIAAVIRDIYEGMFLGEEE